MAAHHIDIDHRGDPCRLGGICFRSCSKIHASATYQDRARVDQCCAVTARCHALRPVAMGTRIDDGIPDMVVGDRAGFGLVLCHWHLAGMACTFCETTAVIPHSKCESIHGCR